MERVPFSATWLRALGMRKLSALVLLLGALQSASQNVQWVLSNAEADVSCNSVCSVSGFKCTEDCWPAAVAGLREAVRAPQLAGVCFQVSEGPAQLWHPAKDADNTLCYWNPGRSQEPRCPVVSKTPAKAATEGRWTRRICPCLNQTAVVASDCGMRNEPAAQHLSDSLSAWSKAQAQSTTPSPAPQFGPTAKPIVVKKVVAVPQTCSLCIAGFAGEDTTLNGRYSRAFSLSGGTSWQQGSVMLEKGSNGHWQFRERQMDGKYVPISQGSLLPSNSAIPQSDFYSTSTGGWDVEFSSCCGYANSASSANSSDGDNAISAGVIVLVVIAVIILVTAILCCKFRRQVRLRFRRLIGKEDPTTSFKSSEVSDAELGQSKAVDSPRAVKLTAQDLRAAAIASGSLPPVPAVPATLADTKNYAHGVYEGPMQPWWGEGSDAETLPTPKWQYGDKVRLCGLMQGSTWNGCVGVVDGSRIDGFLQIKLPDGRLKAVRPENCESPDAPPARATGGWRGTSDSGATNRSAQHETPMGRGKFHDPNAQQTTFPNPDAMSMTNASEGTPHSDAGAGVTSWLASTAAQQDVRRSGGQGNLSQSESWAKLPQKSAPNVYEGPMQPWWGEGGAGSTQPVATPSRAPVRGQEPPVPPRGGRASSCDTGGGGPAQHMQQPSPARRSASSGPPGNRGPSPAAAVMRDTPAVAAPRRQKEPAFGLQDDLALAQKRTKAKLAALRTQLGGDYAA